MLIPPSTYKVPMISNRIILKILSYKKCQYGGAPGVPIRFCTWLQCIFNYSLVIISRLPQPQSEKLVLQISS
jgi:hypothetical protein